MLNPTRTRRLNRLAIASQLSQTAKASQLSQPAKASQLSAFFQYALDMNYEIWS